jgi:cytochrome c-type biogenesis protein CcmH/NrfF
VRILAVLLAILAVAVASGTASAVESAANRKDPARAITSQLICPCSCGEILSGCICETGVSMNAYVAKEVKAGKSPETIEAALVAKYGEVILGAPKAKGFNLLVWILPFVATAVGLSVAWVILRRWVRRKNELVPAGPAVGSGSSAEADLDALRARAEAELRKLRE